MSALAQTTARELFADALTCQQWTKLMQCARASRGGTFSEQAFRKACAPHARMECVAGALRQVFDFAALHPDWQRELEALRARHDAASFTALFGMMEAEQRSAPQDPTGKGRKFSEYPATSQQRALWRQEAFKVYWIARDAGRTKEAAIELLRAEWNRILTQHNYPGKRTVGVRIVHEWIAKVDKSGGAEAPREAYLDDKSCEHVNQRKELPADLVADLRGQLLDSSKGEIGIPQVYANYEAAWQRGEIVPGLGCRQGDEIFPITVHQLERYAPSRAARKTAGRSKFLARVSHHLAAPPVSWADVEPVRVVFFDDKVLDVLVLTDDGRRAFRPHIYIAYCGGTGRVLSFIAREEGRMTKLDVEGLQCGVLRDHGMGGAEAGWPTRWVKERGTVSISDERKQLLESLFPGRLEICRTMMVGGKAAPGDWTQKGSGNFFGKGRLEAFMGSLDHLAKTLPAQTGNDYSVQPAVIGDTTLTIDKIVNSARLGHRSSGSLLEDGLLTAFMGRVLVAMETGEIVSSYEASKRTGVRSPMLHQSDFVTLLGELFRQHNTRRGHRMDGFAKIRVPHPLGGSHMVAESPSDKAARMLEVMRLQGRALCRPDDRDLAALLHKVKRVTVTPNGVVTEGLRYWHPDSQALRDAAAVMGAKTVRLALYNPVQPDALYLLANPPSHLAAAATELPKGFIPQLAEVLPVYQAPSPVDAQAMEKRNREVAAFNGRIMRELAVHTAPMLAQRADERAELNDRLDPLRATLRSAPSPVEPTVLPATALSGEMTEAEAMLSAAASRAVARREAEAAQPTEPTGLETFVL